MSLTTGCTDKLELARLLDRNQPNNFMWNIELWLTQDGDDSTGLDRFFNNHFSQSDDNDLSEG